LFAEHAALTTAAVVLAHQLGIPVPAFPALIWAGAVAYGAPGELAAAFALSTVANTLGDLPWYWAGQRYGYRVLKLVCRVTLSPDSCVRQTETVFERRGPMMLVIARFVPGLGTVAPPLAGALRLDPARFVLYDTAGGALRAAVGIGLGVAFHEQIDWLLAEVTALGAQALATLGVLVALYIAYRFAQRWLFLRSLRAARIGVQELSDMMTRGEDPVVLDVRSRSHRKLDGRRIPGARAVDLDALERTLADIPRDRDVVVYCACPNDATAAKVALQLRARGLRRVRPLAGGIDAWASAGLALAPITEEASA
jgi:membrane protein DedA with SNARE-associated domain/rhodanese-related sulfurtransferase